VLVIVWILLHGPACGWEWGRGFADRTFVACDLILCLLLLKEKEDGFESYGQ